MIEFVTQNFFIEMKTQWKKPYQLISLTNLEKGISVINNILTTLYIISVSSFLHYNWIKMISDLIQMNSNLIQVNSNLIQVNSILIHPNSNLIQVNSNFIHVNSNLIKVNSNSFQEFQNLLTGYYYSFLRIKYLHMV